jgi:hypothetical protein
VTFGHAEKVSLIIVATHRAILLCQQTPREAEAAKKELRHALGK